MELRDSQEIRLQLLEKFLDKEFSGTIIDLIAEVMRNKPEDQKDELALRFLEMMDKLSEEELQNQLIDFLRNDKNSSTTDITNMTSFS